MAFRKIYPGQKDPNQNGAKEFVDAFLAARKLRDDRINDERNYEINLAKSRREGGEKGFTEEGTVDEEFFTPGSASYKRGTRAAELEQLGKTTRHVIPSNQPSYRQVFAAKGLPLPKEFEDVADQPMDHRYLPALATPVKPTESMSFGDVQGVVQGTADPKTRIPAPFASLARPVNSSNRDQLLTPEQQRQYEQMTGVAPGTAKGMTVGMLSSTVSNVRGQQAAGDRQGKALGQSASQFGQKMEFDQEKDLQSRVQAFRDDYAKTGIPTMLPKFQKLNELTGMLTDEKPDLSKTPGYGTNALRSLPIAGNILAGVAAKQYGGEEVNQTLQNLLNSEIRSNSGQAVTKYEEGRSLLAAGMGAGGNQEDIARGVKMMYEAMQGSDRDARAGYTPDVTSRYVEQGGLSGVDLAPRKKKNASAARAESAKRLNMGKDSEAILEGIDDPKNPSKNRAAQAAHKKAAPRLYQGEKKAAAPAGPKAGDVVDGYRFKGGNAGDQKNWEKVK